ncbi:hypothetical protein M3Y96_00888600 [Aphelenchoides besseyi]|nr:hypothetical protein M3Y96_00888600 [Aphelenchoides besseyi]
MKTATKHLLIETSDFQKYEVPIDLLYCASVFRTLFNDSYGEMILNDKPEPCALPRIESPIFERILTWCHYQNHCKGKFFEASVLEIKMLITIKNDLFNRSLNSVNFAVESDDFDVNALKYNSFDQQFLDLPERIIHELLYAANYLGIEDLAKLARKKIELTKCVN